MCTHIMLLINWNSILHFITLTKKEDNFNWFTTCMMGYYTFNPVLLVTLYKLSTCQHPHFSSEYGDSMFCWNASIYLQVHRENLSSHYFFIMRVISITKVYVCRTKHIGGCRLWTPRTMISFWVAFILFRGRGGDFFWNEI
jgi:hypothetical protein